jgi:branched-chain amino acid transport system substrate-binding protein
MRTAQARISPRPRCRTTLTIAAASLSLFAAACGTQVDKKAYLGSLEATGGQEAAGPLGTTAPTGTGTQVGSAPGVTAPGTQTGTQGGSGGAGAPAVHVAGPAAVSGSKPVTGTGNAAAPSGLSTAVIGKTIVIGLGLPLTGAAPLPMSWQTDVDVVQQYMNDHPVNGRTFKFVIQDDGYDPSMGMAACQKLIDAQPLAVVSHTSPAVEAECSELLNSRHIPALLRGIPRASIAKCSICYFGTPADDLQGKLLADYVLNRMDGANKKIGVVWQNDQPVAKQTFVDQLKARGVNPAIVVSSVVKQPDYSSIVVKLQQAGAQLVLLSMPPVDAIKLSVQSQSQGYHPTWLGNGTYWNYNMTLESAGMAMDGAVTFSPWPTIDSAAANEWRTTYAKYKPGAQADDIGLIIWGWANLVRSAVEKAGPDLSRASFVAALNSLQFNQPYWNPVSYAGNHYGPTAVAVFQADGQAKRWRQVSNFASAY